MLKIFEIQLIVIQETAHINGIRKLIGHSKTYRQEEGLYVCDAKDMGELNECTGLIGEAGGKVEKIESRYPSLEEMLVKIGK